MIKLKDILKEKAPYKQIGTNKNDGYILHGKDASVEEGKVNQSKVNQSFTKVIAFVNQRQFLDMCIDYNLLLILHQV